METNITTLASRLDPVLVQEAMALIEPAERIALLAHYGPDGDCIGSVLGFAHILSLIGKTCIPVCADPAPRTLAFLPGVGTLQQTLDDENFDLVIALDAGELIRFGSVYEQHRTFLDSASILNIDHHISSSGCGQVNIIDPTAAATAEILVLFQQQTGLPLNRDAALCLLTGIITDTSSFQYTNTTARTLEAAAVLLRAGAVPDTIVRPVYRTRLLEQARFQAMVMMNARTSCGGRLIWSQATDETLAATGATPEMDDNFSGMLRDIEGVEIAAFFRSYGDPTTTRVSLRSVEPYNVAEICQRFGGGGHARAAGATLHMPIEEATRIIVAELEKVLNS